MEEHDVLLAVEPLVNIEALHALQHVALLDCTGRERMFRNLMLRGLKARLHAHSCMSSPSTLDMSLLI